MSGRRDRRLALLLCLLAGVAMTAGVWSHPGSRWLGYVGDPQQTTWFLRWTPYALQHGWNPLTTQHVAYPGGANLMWNTAVVLVGLVLAPVTVTLGPVVAYNVALLLAFALSGLAAYAALRRLVGPGWAALCGALFYELSPYTAAHALGQLNMTAAVAPPLVLLLVHEALVRWRWPAWRVGVLLGLVAACQALVSEEMLASTGLAALVFVVVLAAVSRVPKVEMRRRGTHGVRVLAWSLAVFGPLMAYPLWVQFAGPQSLHGAVQRPGVFVSDLANVVVPAQTQLVSPNAAVDFTQRFSGNPVEWSAYLGVPLLLVLLWVCVRRWRADRVVRIAAVCGGVFLLLSLGPSLRVAGVDTGVPLPWRVVEHVPLLADMLPGRMTLYLDLCVAVLLAVAVREVASLGAAAVRRRALVGLSAVGVTVLPALPLPTDTVPLPAFFMAGTAGGLPEGGTVLVAPWSSDFTGTEAMVWQALAGMGYRMPEGYAMIPDSRGVTHLGPPPTALSRALRDIGAGRGVPGLDGAARAAYVADLRAWDVRAAVVGPMPHRDRAVGFLTGLFGCAPQAIGGVDVWWRAGADGCHVSATVTTVSPSPDRVLS